MQPQYKTVHPKKLPCFDTTVLVQTLPRLASWSFVGLCRARSHLYLPALPACLVVGIDYL